MFALMCKYRVVLLDFIDICSVPANCLKTVFTVFPPLMIFLCSPRLSAFTKKQDYYPQWNIFSPSYFGRDVDGK